MFDLMNAIKVNIPEQTLKKRLSCQFIFEIKSYIKINYPEYEFLFVSKNVAVCKKNGDGDENGEI